MVLIPEYDAALALNRLREETKQIKYRSADRRVLWVSVALNLLLMTAVIAISFTGASKGMVLELVDQQNERIRHLEDLVMILAPEVIVPGDEIKVR